MEKMKEELLKKLSLAVLKADKKIKLPDKLFIKALYRFTFEKKLNLKNPKGFNEKMQWLKLYDRKKEYTEMVDKYKVKQYVANKIGKEYVIPLYGVWEKFDDIDFGSLPDKFVLKCTHDSGGLVIVDNKDKLDIDKAKNKINNSLKVDYFRPGREWPYKNVKPQIIAEKYMASDKQKELIDYKFFCFNGVPKLLYVSEGLSNHATAKMNFFDMDYNRMDFYRKDYNQFNELPPKPKKFEKMKELAILLSKNIPFLRVDFYEIDGMIYFGELTFYPCSGLIPFEPEEWDKKLGDMLKLPNNKEEEKYEK